MKRLIVNADDFGAAASVNRGILHAYHNGIVTSTTVMINCPDAAPGLEQALASAPDLGIGLHLNLTEGRPVSPPESIPSLVNPDGFFYDMDDWPARLKTFEGEHIQREVTAQINRFIALTGRPPDHLDSHCHTTYLHPAGMRAMLVASRQYNIPMRQARADAPIEIAVRMLQSLMPSLSDYDARGLVEQLQAVIAEGPAPFWPARFEMGFAPHRATLGDLLVILTNLPDDSPTELMTHPGFADDVQPERHAWRANEVSHLTHAAALECVRSEGIELITFGDLSR
jgi:predicted glycoside hydrolase/deacetylase ChbG (UPF0249 family)